MADPAPVHGKVTLPSGAALKGGVLTFHPVDVESGGKLRFEGAALVNVKGEYVAGFNGDGKGVAPGDYVVTAAPRDMNEVPGSNSGSIPAAYRNKKTSPLKISVKDGDNKIDLTIK
jgi:hypothetical protein